MEAVWESYPDFAIVCLEERADSFQACLQAQRCEVGVLHVVALLVSQGAASPQHHKIGEGRPPKIDFKREHGCRAANARCTAGSALLY